MTDSTTTTAQDPAAIESDIRRTQDQISRTVDKIGDQLTPRNLLNSLLDKAEDNNIDARYLLDGARRNPIALAMIAGGAIWLVSDSDAKLPNLSNFFSSEPDTSDGHYDPVHRDYIAHMERMIPEEGEDQVTYQRRRDQHRANYFMLERGHQEDDHSFRQRLDQVAEQFRRTRQGWTEAARDAAGSMRDSGSAAVSQARSAYAGNPLIGGLIAAALGAIAGTALPLTQTEDDQLASVGESARDMIGEQKDRLVDAAREKKDELISKAQESAPSPAPA